LKNRLGFNFTLIKDATFFIITKLKEYIMTDLLYGPEYFLGPEDLPSEYKKALISLLSFQADSEFMGGIRVSENLRFAPRPEEALRLAKKVKEEFGHGVYLWNILRDLGVNVNERVKSIVQNPKESSPGGTKIINAFKYENWSKIFQSWEDVAVFSLVVTPGAVAFLGQYKNSSYKPWAIVSERIFKEELGHLNFGEWAAKRVIEFDGQEGRQKLQQSVEKLLPFGLGFYGRDSVDSKHFKMYHELGLKPSRPEDLRSEYLDLVKKRLEKVGLVYPEKIAADYEMNID
jgi:ring-1,2-phenylacetyl-CoA epoxidase subunit PaaA